MPKPDMTMVPNEYKSDTGRYKPGHDAKHVSHLLEGLRADSRATRNDRKIPIAKLREAQKELPTEHLRAKLEGAVRRHNDPPAKPPRDATDKPDRRDATDAPDAPAAEYPKVAPENDVIRYEEIPDVKVGRWYYPARVAFLDGGGQRTERNAARDGSGAWLVA